MSTISLEERLNALCPRFDMRVTPDGMTWLSLRFRDRKIERDFFIPKKFDELDGLANKMLDEMIRGEQ